VNTPNKGEQLIKPVDLGWNEVFLEEGIVAAIDIGLHGTLLQKAIPK
jgi:hypothetical protein